MHSSRSYYPPDPYAVHQQHNQIPASGQYGSVTGNTPYTTSQHNHSTYYSDPNVTSQGGGYYDQNYPQTQYHHQHYNEAAYGTVQHQQTQPSTAYYGTNVSQHEMSYPPPQQSLPPPGSAQPPGVKIKPSPFGATGPYGSDAQNSSLDYYRRLYYPYDPITGEYMKDATPPGGGDGMSTFPGPDGQTSSRPYASGSGYTSNMNENINGGWSSMNANTGSGTASGQMMVNAATAAAAAGGAHLNPYMIRPYQENDSLLLCCDFLIPRPSINCLIIALFTMLVLIVIFTVVKFTIIYPAVDKSHQETLVLVDQITVILLLCALAALIWIFGIYFTSRRTRRQISSLLSCTSSSPHTSSSSYARRLMRAGYLPPGYTSGSGGAYQTTLVNDSMQYNNQYSNSRTLRNYDSNYSNRNASQYPNYV